MPPPPLPAPDVNGLQSPLSTPSPPSLPKDLKSFKTLKRKAGSGITYHNGAPLYIGKTVREMANEGAEVYINGDQLLAKVAKTLCDENTYSSILVTECADGNLKVELENHDD